MRKVIVAVLVAVALTGVAVAAEPEKEKPKEPTVEELKVQVEQAKKDIKLLQSHARVIYEARDACEGKLASERVQQGK